MPDDDSYYADFEEFPPELDGSSFTDAIRQDDIAQLNRYIASFPPTDLVRRTEAYHDDPFYLAVSEAGPETLHILLNIYTSAVKEEPAQSLKHRPFSLLHVACRSGNVGIVRFFLDNHESLESRLALGLADLNHQDFRSNKSLILEAAASLSELYLDEWEERNSNINRNEWFQDWIARGEETIQLLLERGCSTTDIIPPLRSGDHGKSQPQDSVLGLAVSRGRKPLIQRLITSGADVFLKHMHFHDVVAMFAFRRDTQLAHDVTTLHKAALFWNADAVELLLDYQSSGRFGRDLAKCRDTNGGLPLHWAAAGPGIDECKLRDKDLQIRISTTFKLLLSANAGCGGSAHAETVVQCLLDHDADPTIMDRGGKSVLHMLGYGSLQGGPISTAILDSLLSHGVDINKADNKGITALHVMVQNLRQISTVKYLLEHGADLQTSTANGNTVFHLVAQGRLLEVTREDGESRIPTSEDYTRAEDKMLRLLQAYGERSTLINQRNLAGKTPLELLEETRKQRREREEQMHARWGRDGGMPQRPGE
ncbi:ankyrin repeat-containing domain protein [Aspergillus pseudodeflectus]|uniref:Ankyrin repeat-containing domain protein n=1 Tax=Aspergillus pseudodeflectus TaxID=176178 RepID=A0ABR4KCT2_9EURO